MRKKKEQAEIVFGTHVLRPYEFGWELSRIKVHPEDYKKPKLRGTTYETRPIFPATLFSAVCRIIEDRVKEGLTPDDDAEGLQRVLWTIHDDIRGQVERLERGLRLGA